MSETTGGTGTQLLGNGAQPLTGVRVIEFAHWMAGPLAGGLLADWGADVIKVEPPGGEPMRALFASLGARSDAPNGAFLAANRGKRSVELEIKSEEGSRAFEKLLETEKKEGLIGAVIQFRYADRAAEGEAVVPTVLLVAQTGVRRMCVDCFVG